MTNQASRVPSQSRLRSPQGLGSAHLDVETFEKRGDRAMVIVAHQTDLIRAHCDHAAILDQGRLTVCDRVDEAIRVYENL